jgi:hypothetical protein
MSKAALNCAGATLARDLKGDGIAIALIHPGAVSHRETSLRAHCLPCREDKSFNIESSLLMLPQEPCVANIFKGMLMACKFQRCVPASCLYSKSTELLMGFCSILGS